MANTKNPENENKPDNDTGVNAVNAVNEAEASPNTGAAVTVTPEMLQAMVENAVQARLEAIKANEETAKAEVMEESTKEETPDPLEEYVSIQLFKDGKDYKDDVFVSVNGENCFIKRGVPVKIKRKFALVLDQAQIQSIKSFEYQEREQEKAREAANLGVI